MKEEKSHKLAIIATIDLVVKWSLDLFSNPTKHWFLPPPMFLAYMHKYKENQGFSKILMKCVNLIFESTSGFSLPL